MPLISTPLPLGLFMSPQRVMEGDEKYMDRLCEYGMR